MKQLNSKGQVATEYLLLVGFLLAVVGVASIYALFLYQETIKVNQAKNAVELLGATADQAFTWGSGNALIVNISLPYGVQEICADNNTLRLRLSVAGGENYATYVTKPSLTPNCNLPTIEGRYRIRVAVEDENVTFTEV
jgi:hypothetical protein